MHTLTSIAILVGVLFYAVYTAVMAGNGTPGDTVSAVLRTISRDWWIVSYVFAGLISHWFLGHEQAVTTPRGDTLIAVLVTWSLFVLNVMHFRNDWSSLPASAYLSLIGFGLFVGHFFWSQAGNAPLQ